MEADMVVNFLNFYIDVEEEDLSSVLEELQSAGIERNAVDQMFVRLLYSSEICAQIKNNSNEEGVSSE
ncbi:MAG: hypothetical protein IPM14_14995 [bacterium]|nr:hypothetical protein [bacterium]